MQFDDFRSPFGIKRLECLFELLLNELSTLDVDVLYQSSVGPESSTKTFIRSLKTLFETSNSTTLPVIIQEIANGFDRLYNASVKFFHFILSLLIHNVPAQHLCLLISEFFQKIEASNDRVACLLTEAIADLLKSNRSPLGHSAIEILDRFLKIIRKKQRGQSHANSDYSNASSLIIFTICSAATSILSNASFTLQKFEIIEALLTRTFLKSQQTELNNLSSEHSLSNEDTQYISVIWGILFSLAENEVLPSIRKFAYMEVNVRLFELLFKMVFMFDSSFQINTFVLWRILLHNGLNIAPHRQSDLQESSLACSYNSTSQYIFTKTRITLASYFNRLVVKSEEISINHLAAMLSVIRNIIYQSDLIQTIHFLKFILWMVSIYSKMTTSTDVEKLYVLLCCYYTIRSAGYHCSLDELSLYTSHKIDLLSKAGIKLNDIEELINIRYLDPLNYSVDMIDYIPNAEEIFSIFRKFSASLTAQELKDRVEPELTDLHYDLEAEIACLNGIKAEIDFVCRPLTSSKLPRIPEIKNTGVLARLSNSGNISTSINTAPPLIKGHYSVIPSSTGSMISLRKELSHSTSQIDLLESQFDSLSLNATNTRNKTKHMSHLPTTLETKPKYG